MPSRTDLLQEDYLHREGQKAGEFQYFWPDGTSYSDEAGIKRIAALAVPPSCRRYPRTPT